jgi:hypothetical protein
MSPSTTTVALMMVSPALRRLKPSLRSLAVKLFYMDNSGNEAVTAVLGRFRSGAGVDDPSPGLCSATGSVGKAAFLPNVRDDVTLGRSASRSEQETARQSPAKVERVRP